MNILITEHQYSKLIQNKVKELKKSPYGRSELLMMRELLVSGDPENIKIVFAMLKRYPTILDKLIKSTFGDLLSLARLDPSEEGVIKLMNLQSLAFQNKGLEELPANIGILKNLQQLNLNNNNLRYLPETIGNLHNLERIFVCGNKLTALPESLKLLPNLKRMSISRNPWPNGEILKIRQMLPNVHF